MKYDSKQFAMDLSQKLQEPVLNYDALADWAYRVRLSNLGAIDPHVSRQLEELGAMSMGSEFHLSRQELEGIARQMLAA